MSHAELVSCWEHVSLLSSALYGILALYISLYDLVCHWLRADKITSVAFEHV